MTSMESWYIVDDNIAKTYQPAVANSEGVRLNPLPAPSFSLDVSENMS